MNGEIVFWLQGCDPDRGYDQLADLEAPYAERFTRDLQKDHKIVGLVIEGDKIKFILDRK